MPKRCIDCQHYAEDPAGGRCPACGGPLATTLLPPPAAPVSLPPEEFGMPTPRDTLAHARYDRRRSQPGIAEWLTGNVAGLALFLLVVVVLAGFAADWVTAPETGDTDSTGRIRSGMPISEVARVIEADRPPDGDLPHLTRDFPPGTRPTGWLTWRENGRVVFIRFVNGTVTGVRDEPARPHSSGNVGRQVQIDIE